MLSISGTVYIHRAMAPTCNHGLVVFDVLVPSMNMNKAFPSFPHTVLGELHSTISVTALEIASLP